MLAEHSRAFGLRFVPAAAYCQRVASPIVVGVLRPVILLPMFLATGLSIEQIEAILAHELAHIRRHDPLINLIQRVIETFLFFHPAVWWVSRCIRLERENSCDDAAMSAGMERHTYAQSLLHMAQRSLANDMERRRQVGIALTAGNASQLRSRIIRLLQGPEEVVRLSRSWPIAITVAALIAGVLIPLSVTCATQPAWQTANSMARRDELLAQADAQIRHGLVELAAWYPELSADDGIGWENINTPSETGQLNISLFHFHIKGRHTRNKVPEGVVVDLSVILHPSDGLPDQMDSVKLLNWGLAGQIRIDAADPQLKKAMRDLVEKSLAPLFNGHP
jgi:hypothetical protein